MREQMPRLNITQQNDVSVIKLIDRKILDEVSISQIGDEINSIVNQSPQPKIVLDFSNVAHMSSSALGMLITLHKRIREKKGQLRLCNIQRGIYEVFVITRLSEIFQICQDSQQAISSL